MISYTKSLSLNLLCIFSGVLVAILGCGLSPLSTLLFIAVTVWLCNELWYRVMAIPALFSEVWGAIKKKSVSRKTEKRIYHLTSFILLIAPHLLFALLFFINYLTGNKIAEEFGLSLTHKLFACTYCSVVALWIASLKHAVYPLSLEIAWTYFFEPELFLMRSGDGMKDGDETPPAEEVPAAVPPPLPANTNAVSVRHPELRKLAGALLYYGRPELGVMNAYVRRNQIVGIVMLVAVLLFAIFAVQLYSQTLIGAGLCAALAFVFGFIACSIMKLPKRWNEKLSKAEFAVSRDNVYIVEGEDIRCFPLDTELCMVYENVSGHVGTIHFDHPSLHQGALGRLFAKVGAVDTSNQVDFEAPLKSFCQIADAEKVYQLIKNNRKGS